MNPLTPSQFIINSLQSNLNALAGPPDTPVGPSPKDEEWAAQHTTHETWDPVITAILSATRTAFPSSPPLTPHPDSFTAFQRYWRGVFSTLLETVNSDITIPEFVTNPPRENLSVYLFTNVPHDKVPCTALLPDVKAGIYIENNDGGVRKGDLVSALGLYLYGSEEEDGPRVYKLEEAMNDRGEWNGKWHAIEEGMRGALVYGRNWMDRACFKGEVQSLSGNPKVWLYCGVEGFVEESEREKGREHWFDESPRGGRREERIKEGIERARARGE